MLAMLPASSKVFEVGGREPLSLCLECLGLFMLLVKLWSP